MSGAVSGSSQEKQKWEVAEWTQVCCEWAESLKLPLMATHCIQSPRPGPIYYL